MRIDKYLWAVRLFKTRSLATKQCNDEKVKLNGEFVKASKSLTAGNIIEIKVNPIWKKFRVLGFPKSRVGAKLVFEFLKEETKENDLKELEYFQEIQRQMRQDGFKGRPTKRDRRKLDNFNM